MFVKFVIIFTSFKAEYALIITYLPINDLYINLLSILEDNYLRSKKSLYIKVFNSLIKQISIIECELEKLLHELDSYVENRDFSLIDSIDIFSFYDYIDSSISTTKHLLNYIEIHQHDSNYLKLYSIVDNILTLLHQIEDRISVLESYKMVDIKKVS